MLRSVTGFAHNRLRRLLGVLAAAPFVTGPPRVAAAQQPDPLAHIVAEALRNNLGVTWAMVFAGGIGRVLSILSAGTPPVQFIFFTALEIVGAPLFIYWQHRVAQSPASLHAQGVNT